MEAEKLKKKLNGSTLKGTKVRIEDAKPEKKKRKAEVDDAEEDQKVKKRKVRKEKAKREDGVLLGHELKEGRRIKRGWTEDGVEPKKKDKKSKKAKHESKNDGIEKKKLRFKTSIPPNAAAIEPESKSKSSNNEKKKKEKKAERTGQKAAIVHEFAKSKKPVAAGIVSNEKPAVEYEDGKGWVDDGGNVVEAAIESKRPKRKTRSTPPKQTEQATASNELAADVATEGASDDQSSEVEEESSVVSESDGEAEEDADEEPFMQNGANSIKVPLNDEVVIPPSGETARDCTPQPAETVHPLEALFKRPAPKPESASKPKPGPIDTSFSFFNSGSAEGDDDDMQDVAYPPQTPHTKEDLEWRSIRSAAPTPDTAAIGRKFSFPFARGDVDEDEDEDGDEDMGVEGEGLGASDVKSGAQSGEREESEFRKLFFDQRGDFNRGWKKRKRETRKAKRQMENRRVGRRAV